MFHKKKEITLFLFLLFLCGCAKQENGAKEPTPTQAPGTWCYEPGKNDEFDYTVGTYDYACFITEIRPEEMKIVIDPIRYIDASEIDRWHAAGNEGEMDGSYDIWNEAVDKIELTLTEATEYHMSIHPSDVSHEYVKEHCDRYFGEEYVTSDPELFSYHLQHFTESLTQFYEEGKHNLSWFVILDQDGNVAHFIEGPRY